MSVFADLHPPYSVILADPPWAWASWSKKNQTRAAENHYPVMKLDDIKALPVGEIADPQSAGLFMWATRSMLREAFAVMDAWGFPQSSVAFVWAKCTKADYTRFVIGTGYGTRPSCEYCLYGTRGKPPKRLDAGVRELIIAPRREHSRKPDEQYERIERLYAGPYLELFARHRWSEKWDVWGNEAPLDGRCRKVYGRDEVI
jgi:N6-adenosine-specific RNA methylase IME4